MQYIAWNYKRARGLTCNAKKTKQNWWWGEEDWSSWWGGSSLLSAGWPATASPSPAHWSSSMPISTVGVLVRRQNCQCINWLLTPHNLTLREQLHLLSSSALIWARPWEAVLDDAKPRQGFSLTKSAICRHGLLRLASEVTEHAWSEIGSSWSVCLCCKHSYSEWQYGIFTLRGR